MELHPGSGGIFDISADDQLIFSKKQAGRFPAPEEIISKLRKSEEQPGHTPNPFNGP